MQLRVPGFGSATVSMQDFGGSFHLFPVRVWSSKSPQSFAHVPRSLSIVAIRLPLAILFQVCCVALLLAQPILSTAFLSCNVRCLSSHRCPTTPSRLPMAARESGNMAFVQILVAVKCLLRSRS